MSVIENAINKLRVSRAGGAAPRAPQGVRRNRHLRRGCPTARPAAAEGNAAAPIRTPRHQSGCVTHRGAPATCPQERELAQQFRQIKRPLIKQRIGRGVVPLPEGESGHGREPQVPGEGKTFTSLNLGPQHAA